MVRAMSATALSNTCWFAAEGARKPLTLRTNLQGRSFDFVVCRNLIRTT